MPAGGYRYLLRLMKRSADNPFITVAFSSPDVDFKTIERQFREENEEFNFYIVIAIFNVHLAQYAS